MENRKPDSQMRNCAACAAMTPGGCTDQRMSENVVAQFNLPRFAKTYERGETVFHEGEDFTGVYCLESGLVAMRRTSADGSTAVVRMVQPGELFGYRSFLTGDGHSANAEALVDSKVCFVRRDILVQATQQSPDALQSLVKQMGRDMGGIEHLYMLTVTKSVPSRLAHFLLGLASQVDPDENGLQTFRLPVAKKDFADIIGVAVESLSRVFSRMRQDGIIEEHRGWVTLKDKEALLDLVDQPEEF